MKPSALLTCACLGLCVTAWAAAPSIPFKEYKLKNGLRVILSEDHNAPTYSIAVTYNVGSRDELPGHTGFAHLFEHMMFQGSEKVGKGEQFLLIQNNGGNMNGTTSSDRTNYFETLPANQLDLGLFLEADRMKSLVINQANLDNQRNAVQEERRLGVDNQPYGKTFESIFDTAFDDFGYKHSTIGSMDDLNKATLQDVQSFFKRYYAPNNATIAVVGDFKSDEVMAKMEKYFGGIPAQPAPPQPDVAEPEQRGERRKTIEDGFAQIPRIDIVYKIPAGNSPDIYALDVLGDVLAAGQSSRLYQKLVKEQESAAQLFGGTYEQRGTSLELFIALVRPGKTPADVEKSILEEIKRVQDQPITDQELDKIRMRSRSNQVAQLRGSLNRAIELSKDTVFYNDPGRINTYEEHIQKVTKEDVQRVAKKYLQDSNKTVIVTMPKPQQASQGGGK
ncbi:MAG: protease3 [Bryobacterales bacterium]|nr:protease3 [Bryobacterales bacterium]